MAKENSSTSPGPANKGQDGSRGGATAAPGLFERQKKTAAELFEGVSGWFNATHGKTSQDYEARLGEIRHTNRLLDEAHKTADPVYQANLLRLYFDANEHNFNNLLNNQPQVPAEVRRMAEDNFGKYSQLKELHQEFISLPQPTVPTSQPAPVAKDGAGSPQVVGVSGSTTPIGGVILDKNAQLFLDRQDQTLIKQKVAEGTRQAVHDKTEALLTALPGSEPILLTEANIITLTTSWRWTVLDFTNEAATKVEVNYLDFFNLHTVVETLYDQLDSNAILQSDEAALFSLY